MIFATLRLLSVIFFRGVGHLFFYIFKKRRNVAIKNVTLCYPFLFKEKHACKKKVKSIVRKSFVGLGQNLADFLLLPWYTKKNIDTYVKVKNFAYLQSSMDTGRGVILSAAHFGSWELAAHYFALKGYESLILYNRFKEPAWLDGYVKRRRELGGNTLLEKRHSFLSLYKHLKRGGATVLLTDQHAVPPEGERMSLLGQPAFTHTSFVRLSLKTDAIIVPVYVFTKGLCSYEVVFYDPIDPRDYGQDPVRAMAARCNAALEDAVVRDPRLWMWQHRRFKRIIP